MKSTTKQRLVATARMVHLLPLLDAARFMRTKWQSAEENRRFMEAHPDFTPPPLWWMHDMYRHTSFDQYWRTGKNTAEAIVGKINAYSSIDRPRVADWGCGLARIIRHLPEKYQRTGFDYNAAAIGWNAEYIAGVKFRKNTLMPPLSAPNEAFDALYALSVFTHLSAEAHVAWIAEIERVLAPGGIFLGAFHMHPEPGQLLPGEQARFDAGELVVRGGVKEGSRTYTAHHPESYLRDKLLRNFELLEEPSALFGQTLLVARKRVSG
ncbi:MAG: class I SAM-dependent methyltransferase [Marinicaulis sp.]|nr:class I SAM-dependent methyltransferase [Marinicaulis sp.]